MPVIVADHSGFCFGVKRAIAIAQQEAPVATLGPLIHNPQEVKRLADCGIVPISDLDELVSSKLVISSHGADPAVIAEARQRGRQIVDATCPLVKRSQLLAEQTALQGRDLIIFGDAHHPEVKAISGWFKQSCNGKVGVYVVPSLDEAAALPVLDHATLIAQTTQIKDDFLLVAAAVASRVDDLEVCDTICNATINRQQAALALAAQVDLMLVIGGRNSANTNKLFQICSRAGATVFLLESAAEILPDMTKGKVNIGITAGASAPDWIIKEVVAKMTEEQKLNQQDTETEEAALDEIKEVILEAGEIKKEIDELIEEVAEVISEEIAGDNPDVPQEAISAIADDIAEDIVVEAINDELAQEEPDDLYDMGSMKDLHRGSRINGVIVQVKPDALLVDIGAKSEGILPAGELTSDDASHIEERFHVGDEIPVLVMRRENKEGYPVLSKKRIDQEVAWDKLIAIKDNNETIEGTVTEVVRGGVLVDVGVRGFVPASLVSYGFVEKLDDFLGKTLKMKIIDCEKGSNKLVLSAKAALREESQKKRSATWDIIAEGQTVKGVVRRLTNFGAFIDIGGVDGLLHVSEMAWYRVDKPADILKEGDELNVLILGIDREKEKVSLGLKQLVANPWTVAVDKYAAGSIVDVKVMRLAPFGAFVEVEPGVEGLIHISQLAHERVAKTEDVVTPGEIIAVKVLSIDPEAKRISLSLKATIEPPTAQDMPLEPELAAPAEAEAVAEAEADAPEAAAPVADAPAEDQE